MGCAKPGVAPSASFPWLNPCRQISENKATAITKCPQSQRLAVESVNSPHRATHPHQQCHASNCWGWHLHPPGWRCRHRPLSPSPSKPTSEPKPTSKRNEGTLHKKHPVTQPTNYQLPLNLPSDFDALNHNITELMGRINQQ